MIARNAVETQAVLRALPELDETEIPAGLRDARTIVKQAVRARGDRLEDEELERVEIETYSGQLDIDTVQRADVRTLELPAESVHMAVVDPPDGQADLDTCGAAASLAARALRPGCFALIYVGKLHLPDILGRVREHLTYRWMFGDVHMSGNHIPAAAKPLRITEKWRPIIVLQKPGTVHERKRMWDAIQTPEQMDQHEWQSSSLALSHYISGLTRPGDVVLDPMCSTGTVPATCVKLNRHFLAFSADPNAVERTLSGLGGLRSAGTDGPDRLVLLSGDDAVDAATGGASL